MRESALNAVLTILASSPAEVRSALTGTTIQSFVTEKEVRPEKERKKDEKDEKDEEGREGTSPLHI